MNIWIYFLVFTTIHCQISTDTQTSCFRQFPIYRSNSPHQIQKKGDQICIKHDKYTDAQNLLSQRINSSTSARSLNLDNSASLPSSTPINLTIYEAGTSVFKFTNSTPNRAYFYTLPVGLLNGPMCSSYEPITYMNDFTSTCQQIVNQDTCTTQLNPMTYGDQLCLARTPGSLITGTPSPVCCTSTTVSSSTWNSPSSSCSGALKTFELNIYYLNPDGIVNCNFNITNDNASGTSFSQTFTVRFIKNGTTPSTETRSGNPGYLPGSLIKTATLSGNTYTQTSGLWALQPGNCAANSGAYIRFGQNLQSTCFYTGCLNATDFSSFLGLTDSSTLYVSNSGNPDGTSNPWKHPLYCTSVIGSTDSVTCSSTAIPSLSASQCFTRVDIQISYANLGSVSNPQPILGEVIYHFQGLAATTSMNPMVITQTVTFEEMSNPPTTESDLIPRQNTRLPGDFFYPFSLNHSSRMTFISGMFYLLLFIVFLF